jgi:hypothetical protein
MLPMEEVKQLKRLISFKDYPANWRVLGVSVDWAGEPLILFDEGKPPQPPREAGMDALLGWLNTPAQAHHVIYWNGKATAHARFANTAGLVTTSHIQPFRDGWLLGEGRGGLARIFDREGSKLLRTINLGDAIEHIQITSKGHIWVGYFDEGVYGGGIGQSGLICFDAEGNAVFRYSDFATEHKLPCIDDCYALNVCDDAVWVCYYSDFPLVCLRNFQIDRVWKELGATRAFAVRGQRLVRFPAYSKPYLISRTFDDSVETVWKLVDPDGNILSKLAGKSPDEHHVPFSCTARGARIYVWTESALFEVP